MAGLVVSNVLEAEARGLRLTPQDPLENLGVGESICNPGVWGLGTGDPWGFTASQSSLVGEFQISERPCLKADGQCS